MNSVFLETILSCSRCGQKNRVRESELVGGYRCAKCRYELDTPFCYVVFDSETTGLPTRYKQPHLVQLAWAIYDYEGKLLKEKDYIIRPEGFSIPVESSYIHGISDEMARKMGHPLKFVVEEFLSDADNEFNRLVGHNIDFDTKVLISEIHSIGIASNIHKTKKFCTMKSSTRLCKLPKRGGGYKWPKLQELYTLLFGCNFEGGHNAMTDVKATSRCFFELRKRGLVKY